MTSQSDFGIMTGMKTKAIVHRREDAARSRKESPRRATTFRLESRLQRGLELLSDVRKAPLNRLVNEAVDKYLDAQAASLEADLEDTLRRIKAYRNSDPDFDGAIARFAKAEADRAAEDPVEGRTTRAQGPTQRLVRELIRG
jgi:predicted transcriptional regulator